MISLCIEFQWSEPLCCHDFGAVCHSVNIFAIFIQLQYIKCFIVENFRLFSVVFFGWIRPWNIFCPSSCLIDLQFDEKNSNWRLLQSPPDMVFVFGMIYYGHLHWCKYLSTINKQRVIRDGKNASSRMCLLNTESFYLNRPYRSSLNLEWKSQWFCSIFPFFLQWQ